MKQRWINNPRIGSCLALLLLIFSGMAHAAPPYQVLIVTTPKPGSTVAPEDFNGDGLSDLLWSDAGTDRIGYWIMATDSSGSVSRASARIFAVPTGSEVRAVGDINGDGFADMVLAGSGHTLTEWINNRTGGFSKQSLGTYPSGWRLIGAGDIDGDGQDDLLWINDGACQFGYWRMKGGQRVSIAILPIACGSTPLSIGYYSVSRRLSIMWTDATHKLWVWDFTSNGYNTVDLDYYDKSTSAYFIAFGGGYAGTDISFVVMSTPGIGYGQWMQRSFFIDGKQSGYVRHQGWTGGIQQPMGYGGKFVDTRNGVNKTGNIMTYGPTQIGICPPVWSSNSTYDTRTETYCSRFSTSGWFLIGADPATLN